MESTGKEGRDIFSIFSTLVPFYHQLPEDVVTSMPPKRTLSDNSTETAIDVSSIDLGKEKIENAQQVMCKIYNQRASPVTSFYITVGGDRTSHFCGILYKENI